MMIASKEICKAVLEEILSGKSPKYQIISCDKIGDLSQHLEMFYAESFAEFARTRNGRFIDEFSKFHNCAVKYGYRGYSACKNNGIVDITPTNTQLLKDYARL
ncbi:MAG: hypothetical protein QW666_02805, partial [Candidatus Woesearchaeota archaeon]